MSYDDDDDAQVSSQALGGLIRHVDGYKKYVKRLKKGHPSGVSNIFGRPADLLPDELVEPDTAEIEPQQRSYELGESLFKESLDPSIFAGLMDELMTGIGETPLTNPDEYLSSGESAQEIIAVLVENGRKKYLYADLTMVDANEKTSQQIDLGASIELGCTGDSLVEQDSDISPLGKQSDLNDESNGGEDVRVSVERKKGRDDAIGHGLLPEMIGQSEKLVESDFYKHVTSANGEWLWDIVFTENGVGQIIFADGSIMQKTINDAQYVVTRLGRGQEDIPEIEVIGKVLANRETGNIYYQSQRGDQVVVLLKNGWRLEQFKQDNGDVDFFAIEPNDTKELLPRRIRVQNLLFDSGTGEISYETMDGSALVTLRVF